MIATQLDTLNQEILNIIQQDFPLVERPFKAIAERLQITEAEVLDRMRSLKGEVIRQISAIFDTTSLGYKSSLVAAKVQPEHLAQAARIINQHPGVSHNYKRNHEYNLWFTIAIPPNSRLGLEKTVDLLGKLAEVDSLLLLPTLKLFKIGVQFDMTGKKSVAKTATNNKVKKKKTNQEPLTEKEIELIRALQKDLPLEPEPFVGLAQESGVSVEELLVYARIFIERGQMRRYAAVLYHRKAGFTANGMGVWQVEKEKQEEIGYQMASFQAVSHCYLRPTYPEWPYNIFTMVHGRSKEEVEDILEKISAETGISERFVLYSTEEYKKVRVSYFTLEIEAWENENS